MADGAKGDEARGEAEAAGIDVDGLEWSCLLMGVERIIRDPEDEDGEDMFAVKFEVDGPNATAEIEIMVPDAADAEVVGLALDTLHGALVAWASLLEQRRGARQLDPDEA